jgi:GLPGLI family protein
MKTVIKFSFILALISMSVMVFAQKPKKAETFSGVVKYGITYEGEDIDAATLAQLPTEIIVSINGMKSRSEQSSPFYTMASISNFQDGSTIILFDYMGMKVAVNQSKEEIEAGKVESEYTDPVINFVDETKVIAGYTCKKAEVTQGEEITEVYYTDEVLLPAGFNDNSGYKGINGLLMQYSINQGGMLMVITVKEVSKTKPKVGLFLIPDDYEVKTMEEFGGMLGQ